MPLRSHGPQSLKYLLSDPLWKSLLTFRLDEIDNSLKHTNAKTDSRRNKKSGYLSIKSIGFVVKNIPQRTPGPGGSLVNSMKYLRKH